MNRKTLVTFVQKLAALISSGPVREWGDVIKKVRLKLHRLFNNF